MAIPPVVSLRRDRARRLSSIMADSQVVERARALWREKMNEIIFRHDTVPGRVFDVVLLTLILLSVLTVILESVRSLREAYGV